jgi:hypothetical protein
MVLIYFTAKIVQNIINTKCKSIFTQKNASLPIGKRQDTVTMSGNVKGYLLLKFIRL